MWQDKFGRKKLGVVYAGSTLEVIGRAGLKFDLSPTNASQCIQVLEAERGKLFHRTTRVVSLIYDGHVFIE